ncbi:MAG: hypothetical protein BWK78_02645 [Thiotrichaceae bacterium IS1]|nr:MAG: hypothetical protein BWK78_02645 [Thiotrichaceae bacterium IS1]
MLRKLLAFSLLLWTTVVYPIPSVVVGQIEDLVCPSNYYLLLRQGERSPRPVNVFTELQAGDTLALKPNQPVLQSQEATISYAQLPVTIKDSNTQPLCRPELLVITRKEETLPLAGNTLRVGDSVTINPEAPILSLHLNGQPSKTLKYDELAYTIPTGGTTPTVFDNFITQLSSWFTKQHDEQLKVLIGRAGESEKPRINVLKGDKQQLIAGDRELFIAWQSGQPPFTVTMTAQGQPQSYPNLSQRQLRARATLTPGTYRLSIQDARQQTTDYTFTVVNPQPRPPLSQKLRDLSEDSMRLVVQTMCLAVQDKGVWKFEAMQQAAQQVDRYVPARVLRDALLRGANISPLDLSESDCVD